MKVEPLAYGIAECAEALRITIPTIYKLIADEGLPTVKLAGRRLVPIDALKAWLNERISMERAQHHEPEFSLLKIAANRQESKSRPQDKHLGHKQRAAR